MTTNLKVGDHVIKSDPEVTGKVVAIMTEPDTHGRDVIILTSTGFVCLSKKDGSTVGLGPAWTKVPRKVKATLYLNIYRDSSSGEIYSYSHNSEEGARKNASGRTLVVAKRVDYEYEDKS